MELDELKTAWQALDCRLEQHNAINLQLFKDGKTDKVRSSLRPLIWGQLAQLMFGLLMLAFGVAFWTTFRGNPALLAAGVIVHAYGVAVIIASGITLGLAQSIDYGAAVLAIQKQLAKVRRAYVIGGMVAGLPWWLLWMLPVAMLAALSGNVEGVAWITGWFWTGLAIGVAGLFGTCWFHRWTRRPGREQLAKRLDDGLSGASLRKAQAHLDEIARFEQE